MKKLFLLLTLSLPLCLSIPAQAQPHKTPWRFTLLQNDKPTAVFEFSDADAKTVHIKADGVTTYNEKTQTSTHKGNIEITVNSGDKKLFSFSAPNAFIKVEHPRDEETQNATPKQ